MGGTWRFTRCLATSFPATPTGRATGSFTIDCSRGQSGSACLVAASRETAHAGQAIYSPLVLAIYDFAILGISNHLLWRCPTAELRALYDRNIGPRHLDIGVGTGYFLDRAHWPMPNPDITLVDLNPNSLAAAARRIARFHPTTVRANALEPLPDLGRFSSIGLCYLLHCLPGSIATKSVLFDHLKGLLTPGGRIFGATIVEDGQRGWIAERLLALYNAKGVMTSRADYRHDLQRALEATFGDVCVAMKGTVAVFEARAR